MLNSQVRDMTILCCKLMTMSATATLTKTPVAGPPGQPDISYVPDPLKWQARAERRVKAGGLPSTVPDGFPEQLTGDLVWEGETVANRYDWTFVLNDVQLNEVAAAVNKFKCEYRPSSRHHQPLI